MAVSRITLRAVHTGDENVDGALDSLRTDLLPLLKSPLVMARVVTVGAATTQPTMTAGLKLFAPGITTNLLALEPGGTNVIPHSLGRPLEGYLIAYRSANAALWDVDVTTLSRPMAPASYFGVSVSAAVTVKLLVF